MRTIFRRSSSSANTETPTTPTTNNTTVNNETQTATPRIVPSVNQQLAQRLNLPLPPPSEPHSVPVPIRRASAPPSQERWARSTLPSYAVSRTGDPQIPSYDTAIASSPTSPIGQVRTSQQSSSPGRTLSIDTGSGSRMPPRSISDYFGSSSSTDANEGVRPSSPFSPSEDPFVDLETIDEDAAIDEEDLDDDDDDLLPFLTQSPSTSMPGRTLASRRSTISGMPTRPSAPFRTSTNAESTIMEDSHFLDAPPLTALPPAYTAQVGRDELRLISTVHVADDHPAASFLNSNSTSANGTESSQSSGNQTHSTGKKKFRLNITKGGMRMNANGTGPLFIRLGRAGVVAGTIDVGKVDHAVGLEVTIFGYVNTSYYMRGQQSLLDTSPLIRNKVVLFPPHTPESESMNATSSDPSTSANAATTGVDGDSEHPSHRTKDGRLLLDPGQSFPFSLKMPLHHYRDNEVELPPSCSINQIGLQTQIEYVLRVKLIRKGWRLNDTVVVPIWYQPRGYISPRRLTFLTVDEPMNPGWRSISLRGGGPINKAAGHTSINGVEATLTLPSPSLIYLAQGVKPPAIPFHLHFHSSLTLPLATFSDPRQCNFIVRLTRVAIIRLGLEKQVHRFEIPSEVELWQEGGARMMLRHGRVVNDLSTEDTASAVATSPSQTTSPLTDNAESRTITTAGASASTGTGHGSGNERRRLSFAERRASFSLRRRLSTSTTNSTSSASATTTAAAAATATGCASGSGGGLARSISTGVTPTSEHPVSPVSPTVGESPLPPLSLSSTDVHLQGSLQIRQAPFSPHATDLTPHLIQTFNTPDISLMYVVEIGIQPRSGAVKEAFSTIWGGGVVDLVLGPNR